MIGRISFHKWFVSLLMDLRSNIHKYFRDPRNKERVLLKMQPDGEESKRDTIESFFGSCSFEKK